MRSISLRAGGRRTLGGGHMERSIKSTRTESTPYGLGRASPQSFFPHHLAAVSSAIVRADALAIRNNAAALAFSLAHGIA